LNPWLTDVKWLIEQGHASIVQGVGYANSSRSHTRSAEIFETASTADPAPEHGWLGRYLDHACDCAPEPMAGVQFADALGRTLASSSGNAKSIGNPKLLLDMHADDFQPKPGAPTAAARRGSRTTRLDYLRQVENDLGDASRQLRKASKGTSGMYDYPDS